MEMMELLKKVTAASVFTHAAGVEVVAAEVRKSDAGAGQWREDQRDGPMRSDGKHLVRGIRHGVLDTRRRGKGMRNLHGYLACR